MHGSLRPAGIRHSDAAAGGLPRPDPDSDGVRVTQAHASVHGLARPAMTLGIATPIRPGAYARTRTRMASESLKAASPPTGPGLSRHLPGLGRHRRTRSGATPPGICQLWTCRSTTLAGTGYLSAQQPREPHLTTTLMLVASTAYRLVSVKGLTVWERAPFAHRTNAVWHVNGTTTPTAVLRRIHWVRLPTAAHSTQPAPAHVLCADQTSKDAIPRYGTCLKAQVVMTGSDP